MTVLKVYRKDSLYIGFECEGHSGYADAGEDMVCSAVSTAVQYCINCGEQIDRIPMQLTVDQERALIRCISEKPDAQFSKHIAILVELAKSIAKDYAMYFNLEIMEV